MTKQRTGEIINTGVTSVATYLLQGMFGLGVCMICALVIGQVRNPTKRIIQPSTITSSIPDLKVDDEQLAQIKAAAEKVAVMKSANMSLGVALLVELAKKTAAAMPEAEIEIIEKHHNKKIASVNFLYNSQML